MSTNLSGNIILKENDSRFQFLYASQNYTTLYAIYGKFQIDNPQGNKKYLTRIDLELINYKGPLNLGFTQQDQTTFSQDPLDTNNGLIFNVHVKALSEFSSAFIDLKSSSKPEGINVSDFQNIQILRFLHPLSNTGSFDGQVFDNEFYYRDGLDIFKRPLRAGMVGDGSITPTPDDGPPVIMLVGPKCHMSFLEVYSL